MSTQKSIKSFPLYTKQYLRVCHRRHLVALQPNKYFCSVVLLFTLNCYNVQSTQHTKICVMRRIVVQRAKDFHCTIYLLYTSTIKRHIQQYVERIQKIWPLKCFFFDEHQLFNCVCVCVLRKRVELFKKALPFHARVNQMSFSVYTRRRRSSTYTKRFFPPKRWNFYLLIYLCIYQSAQKF